MRAFSFWGPLLALAIIDCGHVGNGEEMMFPNSLWASPLPAQIGMMSVVHKIDIDYSHEYAKDVCFADQVALALFAAFDCEPREVNASFEVLWHKYAMDIIGKRSVIRGSRQHCRKIPTYTNGLYKSNCSASVGYPDGADCIKTSWHQDSSYLLEDLGQSAEPFVDNYKIWYGASDDGKLDCESSIRRLFGSIDSYSGCFGEAYGEPAQYAGEKRDNKSGPSGDIVMVSIDEAAARADEHAYKGGIVFFATILGLLGVFIIYGYVVMGDWRK